MILSLISKYWKYLVIIALAIYIISLIKEIGSLRAELTKSEGTVTQFSTALEYQNTQLLDNDKKYLVDLAEANKTNTVVRTKFRDKITTVTLYKGDKNATDCNSTNAFWATITY